MKYLILVFLFVSCAIIKDGYNKDPEKLKEYIHDAPGITKDRLFVAVNTYVTRNIKGRQDELEYEDKEAGKVIGYLYDKIKIGGNTEIRYKYEIDVKDNKLRCRFSYPELYTPSRQSLNGIGSWAYINAVAVVNRLISEKWDAIPGEIVSLAKQESDW